MPTATAAVLSANHEPFVLEEVEIDSPKRGEVLVRIVATGLCHTDLSVREGAHPLPLPGVLGHEGACVVEEIGDGVTDLEAGDHVVMSFAFCGECRTCRTGHPVYCESWAGLNLFGGARADGTPTIHRNGDALHGHFFGQSSLATRALAPANAVVKVSREAPLELLGPQRSRRRRARLQGAWVRSARRAGSAKRWPSAWSVRAVASPIPTARGAGDDGDAAGGGVGAHGSTMASSARS